MKACPHCHTIVGHKWYQAYRFCSEYCRKGFIKERRSNKNIIPHPYMGQRSKLRIKRRINKRCMV